MPLLRLCSVSRKYLCFTRDSGYPLRLWLMTPILHPASEAHERYNRAQRKTRGVVERCIGVLKSRFQCIDHSGGVLLYTPERACQIIAAVCVLHNICQMHRVPLPNIAEAPDEPAEPLRDVENTPNNSGMQARNNLIARQFTWEKQMLYCYFKNTPHSLLL